MESRFKKPLQKYLNSKIDKDQIGFISDCQTKMNILSLIEEMKQYKAKDQKVALFVDLKSATTQSIEKHYFLLFKKKRFLINLNLFS